MSKPNDEYTNLFDAIQKLVDGHSVSIELGKRMVEELNQDAQANEVPVKFNSKDLELVPSRFQADVAKDSEDDMSYPDEESSSF